MIKRFAYKLRLILKLIKSRTYVVMLDDETVVHIDLVDPHAFEDIKLLMKQQSAFSYFKETFEDIAKEHEEAVKLLKHRKERSDVRNKSDKS